MKLNEQLRFEPLRKNLEQYYQIHSYLYMKLKISYTNVSPHFGTKSLSLDSFFILNCNKQKNNSPY